MVELGGHFLLLFFCKSKQFFNVHVHVHCIFKVTFLVQVQEAVIKYFNQGSICGTHKNIRISWTFYAI